METQRVDCAFELQACWTPGGRGADGALEDAPPLRRSGHSGLGEAFSGTITENASPKLVIWGAPAWPHPLAVVPPAGTAGRTRRVKRTGLALDATWAVCSADGRDDGEEWEPGLPHPRARSTPAGGTSSEAPETPAAGEKAGTAQGPRAGCDARLRAG